MALALSSSNLLFATLTLDTIALEFVLDVDGSVQETLRRRMPQHSGPNGDLYLDGFVNLRRSPSDAASFVLISGQDAGPFHTLLPRFIRIVREAHENDLALLVDRGELSTAVRRRSEEAYASPCREDAKKMLNQLTAQVIAESHLGRMSCYRYGSELLLEVEKTFDLTESFVEVIAQDELLDALSEMEMLFRKSVQEGVIATQ
jgi:hypothetical protein